MTLTPVETTVPAEHVPGGMRHRPVPTAGAVLLVLGLGILVAFVSAATGNERASFAIVGLSVTAIVWFPVALGRSAIVSAWSAVVLVVSVGCGARGALLAISDDDRQRAFFLTDKSFDDLFAPSIILIVIMTAFTGGYFAATDKRKQLTSRRLNKDDALLRGRPGAVLVTALATFGFVGSLLYVRAAGGFDLSLLTSQRRTTITTIDLADQDTFQSYGHWEYLASLSMFAFSLHYARWRILRVGSRGRNQILTAILLANVLLLPVFTTTRGGLLTIVFVIAAVEAAGSERIRLRRVAVWAIGAAIAATSLLGLRSGFSLEQAVKAPFTSAASLPDSLIVNRNMADLGKSLLVIEATGSELEQADGATITGYAFAIIPRSVWADKPLVSPGPIVGTSVYGTRVTGIPPGMAGELVWNFGVALAVLLAGMFGALVGMVDRFARATKHTAFGSVFLALVSMQFARDLLGVSIGRALFTAALSIAILKASALGMRWIGEAR